MATAHANDESILLMFDPLTSPLKSGIPRETPRRRQQPREHDPTSPVAAFFNSVDKSKSLLATVRKQKQADLIDLGGLRPIDEHVEQRGEPPALPSFKITMEDENIPASNNTCVPVIDPFSPATYATSTSRPPTQFFARPLNLRDPTRNTLVVIDTPAKPFQSDLLMSTNFTPVPSHLPYLPNASLSSLRQSGASDSTNPSVTSTPNVQNASLMSTGGGSRRRRSSIDLDRELGGKSLDSSFDILRGELEIGTSADVSFVMAAEDVSKDALPVDPGESPWTIRTTAPSSGYSLGSGLMPVEEVRETSLLAHEIPLPDSCPVSPESSAGNNEDASIHASKVFSHTRRFSMAAVAVATNPSSLQFPAGAGEPSPPRSPKKPSLQSGRKSIAVVHTRTTSMSSISSVSSSRSGITVKGTSPSKRLTQAQAHATGAPQSPVRSKLAKPESPSKSSAADMGSAKRLPRPSSIIIGSKQPPIATSIKTTTAPPTNKPSTPTRAAGGGPKPRPSIAAAPRPRASIVPRVSIAPRSSLASRASTVPPIVSSSGVGGGGVVRRAPRASIQPGGAINAGGGAAGVGPRPSISRVGSGVGPAGGLKQPLRAARASMASCLPTALTGLNAPAMNKTATTTAATANMGGAKAGTTILTPGVRANANGTAPTRMARPSLIGGIGSAGGGVGGAAGVGLKKMASFVGGGITVVREGPSYASGNAASRTTTANDKQGGGGTRPRPRTSSAGAALISRPEYQESALARPVSVARLARPKSSLSRV